MNRNTILLRKFKAGASVLILIVVTALLAARSQAQTQSDFRAGEVLVEIKPGASIDTINERQGTATIQRILGTNFYRLETPRHKKENKFRKRLARDPDVLSATLNPVITTPVNVFGRAVIGFPGDHPTTGQVKANYLAQQLVGDLAAIQLRARGAGVIVAVIDTGIDRNHPDIRDHLWTDPGEIPGDNIDNDNDGLVDDVFGWNFIDGTPDTMEQRGNPQTSVAGHGTFIAGLIALVAPSASIMPIRAFSPDGVSDAFSVAQGIKYAVDHGAGVINLSFGTVEDSQVMHDAVSYAHQRGVLLVAAVGNENKGDDIAPQFPARWNQEVIAIAAVDSNNRKAAFSNYGSSVAVSAAGVNLVSLYPELNNAPDYAMWSGTSFAAPLASATAALILQDNSRQNVRATIEDTATNIDSSNLGFEGKLGKGRIDPLAALQSLQSTVGNRSEIPLTPTGLEPAARGKAEVSINGATQAFEIESEGHYPRAAYKIVVDGKVIIDGANQADSNAYRARATNFGSIKIEFSTNPGGDQVPLPIALNPVNTIKRVEVRDALDRVIVANEFGAPAPGGSSSQSTEKEAALSPTGVLPNAKGRARAEVETEREELRVEGENLTSGVSYQVLVDGTSLGSFVAQSGYIRVEYTSDGSSGQLLPQSLRPVTSIKQIELRDPAGATVLQGSFQGGGDDFGGGSGDGGDSGDGGGGGGDQEISREAQLNPTTVIPDARGKVRTRMSTSRESIEIEGDKLNPNSMYTVVVDGFTLGSFSSDGSGSLKLTLSTETGNLPPQIRPVSNIQNVVVMDSLGRTVLAGGPPV